jgi:recombinational DNA repair protein (RecF pathway)
MEEACLAALQIVEETAAKEEFFEDLLDILDDWEQRKNDP